jgi:predicted amidohydrolase
MARMRERVTVACAQVEPVLFDRDGTIGGIEEVAAEAAGAGARLVLFPEAFVPAYPSNRQARFLASGDDEAKAEGDELVVRGGSAILGPDGRYLAEALWDEEAILYAELDPDLLYSERQRFDPAGHYHLPDVLGFELRGSGKS